MHQELDLKKKKQEKKYIGYTSFIQCLVMLACCCAHCVRFGVTPRVCFLLMETLFLTPFSNENEIVRDPAGFTLRHSFNIKQNQF